jgi:2-methylisocitrate lyase-like PEP mutase family enzyme
LTAPDEIARVVTSVGGPVNVITLPGRTPPLATLASLGVRRVSTGSGLYNAAYRTLREQAGALLV